MNLTALDSAIAVILVILSLSLVVQSMQAFLKKLFKIKSRQLEQSLVDLTKKFKKIPVQKKALAAFTKK